MTPDNLDTADQLFARRLKRFRTKAGLSQDELAHRAGMTSRAISNWERGIHPPRAQNIRDLAKALDLPVSVLCPAYYHASLAQILDARFAAEANAVSPFVDEVTARELERFEMLLKAYELSDPRERFDVDIVMHRTISGFGKRRLTDRGNALILQYFHHVDEIVADSDLLTPARQDELVALHMDLGRAALDRDASRLLAVYARHLEYSKDFVARTIGDVPKQ